MNNKRAKRTYNQRTRKVDIMEIPRRTSLFQYDGNNLQHQSPDYRGTLTNPELATQFKKIHMEA